MTAGSRARLRAITLVSSLALLAAPALAQSTHSTGAPAMGGPAPAGSGGAVTTKPRTPTPDPLTQEDISKIKGTDVYGSDNKKLGDVTAVLMNPQTKTIDRLVVGEGGVLGIGERDVALPINAFSWDAQAGHFKLARTADNLKTMPEWREQVGEAPSGGAVKETPSNGDSMTQTPPSGATGNAPSSGSPTSGSGRR